MNYKTWNKRGIGFFSEEMIDKDSLIISEYPSIKIFEAKDVYSNVLRNKIISYLNQAEEFLATSYRRQNPFTKNICNDLVYYTDGEVIFNNLLLEYIKEDCFVLPDKWLKTIESKNFKMPKMEIKSEMFGKDGLDPFKTFEETFEIDATIKNFIIYK